MREGSQTRYGNTTKIAGSDGTNCYSRFIEIYSGQRCHIATGSQSESVIMTVAYVSVRASNEPGIDKGLFSNVYQETLTTYVRDIFSISFIFLANDL